MTDPVRIDRNDAVLEITLDRPKANSIDDATSQRLGEVFCEFRDDPALRVAIITGAGERFFSAGWDLKAAASGAAGLDYGVGGFAGLTELWDLDKPVIAAVNGYAAGGGFELALACDLVVAVEEANFMLPECRLGIIPDAGGVLRLPKAMPRALAMEMLLTGEPMPAAELARWGVINRVVARADLMPAARELAARMVRAAPLSLAAVKAVVAATSHLSVRDGYALMASGGIPAYERMRTSEDALEGPRAFAEKRDPVWRGR